MEMLNDLRHLARSARRSPAGGPWPTSYDLERSFGVVLGHGLYTRRFAADPDVR
jgi:hypothetical protein